jgi:hypothetical protein
MAEIVLQAGQSAQIIVLHEDGMSTVAINVAADGTWSIVLTPNPAVLFSMVMPMPVGGTHTPGGNQHP